MASQGKITAVMHCARWCSYAVRIAEGLQDWADGKTRIATKMEEHLYMEGLSELPSSHLARQRRLLRACTMVDKIVLS